MQPKVRISLATVVLVGLAACSGGQAGQPESTTTIDQTTSSSTTTSTAVAETTTTVATTTTTTTAPTTTTAETSTTTTIVTTTTSPATTTAPPATTTTTQQSSRQLTITIAGFQYSGDTTGRVGDTIRVVNNDVVSHTWTARNGAFDSGPIGPGKAFTYTFDTPGTYEYYCIPHPGMVGTITISS